MQGLKTLLLTLRFYLKHGVFLLLVVLIAYWAWLDRQVINQFEQQQWNLPARVYAAPLEIYREAPISSQHLIANLELLGYKRVEDVTCGGRHMESQRSPSTGVASNASKRRRRTCVPAGSGFKAENNRQSLRELGRCRGEVVVW